MGNIFIFLLMSLVSSHRTVTPEAVLAQWADDADEVGVEGEKEEGGKWEQKMLFERFTSLRRLALVSLGLTSIDFLPTFVHLEDVRRAGSEG